MEAIETDINILNVRRLESKYKVYTDPDNYQIFWIAKGIKCISVDLEAIPFYPNTILFITPGRVVEFRFLKESPDGWVLGFSMDFFKK
jgi:hypothetical protein